MIFYFIISFNIKNQINLIWFKRKIGVNNYIILNLYFNILISNFEINNSEI